MIKIIDNFLTKTYYKTITELLEGTNFEWNYTPALSEPPDHGPDPFGLKDFGFTHNFWHKTNGPINKYAHFIQPLLFQVQDVTNCDFILRARADMVTWTNEDFIHPAHIDFPFPNTASVFYINESDGDTIFYNVKPDDFPKGKELKEYDRVSPKANRLVIFDGSLLHTGCSPIKHKTRILINSNYIKKEDEKEAKRWLGL